VSGVALRVDRAEDSFGVPSAKAGAATHTTKAIVKKSPSNFESFMARIPCIEGMLTFAATRCAAPSIATPVGFASSIVW
jgi:hypothetical protein